jgi:hypothetical protein
MRARQAHWFKRAVTPTDAFVEAIPGRTLM